MSARAKVVGRARWLTAPPPLAFSLRHLHHRSHSSSWASKAVEMAAAASLKPSAASLLNTAQWSQCRKLAVISHREHEQGNGKRENDSWKSFHGFTSFNACSYMLIGITLCEGDKEKNASEKALAEKFIDQLSPLLSQLTIGTTMGFASGYALRTIGKMAAVMVGCSFMLLQGAAHKGWVNVNWNAASKDLHSALDQDGDGDFDMDDVKILVSRFVEVATYNLPSGTGFTAGLLLGLGFTGGTAGKAAAAVGTATLIPRAIMMGGAATAGSSAMVSFKDQYDAARRSAEQVGEEGVR